MTTPTYDFTGKVALITGASSGMGRAAGEAFAAAGAAVALVDRDLAAAQRLADELTATGARAIAIAADVTDEQQVAAATARAVTELGRLDVAFNNACIQVANATIAEQDRTEFEQVNAVNYTGVWLSLKHELAAMGAQGSGVIINSASIGGLMGGPGRAAYHASKHAVIGLTRSAAKEAGPLGIRVNAIAPGVIDTPMVHAMVAAGALDHDASVAGIPLGRLGRSEEVAQAALWLASDGASFVNGITLTVDGGQLA